MKGTLEDRLKAFIQLRSEGITTLYAKKAIVGTRHCILLLKTTILVRIAKNGYYS